MISFGGKEGHVPVGMFIRFTLIRMVGVCVGVLWCVVCSGEDFEIQLPFLLVYDRSFQGFES